MTTNANNGAATGTGPAVNATTTAAQTTGAAAAGAGGGAATLPDEAQLKVWYEHAKLANTHADGAIQSAERKGTFLLTLNSALFLLYASDLAPKVKDIVTKYETSNQFAVHSLMEVGAVGLAALVFSFIALYWVFKARIEPKDFMKDSVTNPPEEVIFFGEVARLTKDQYFARFEAINQKKACECLTYQCYKQARIANLKFCWFTRARRSSAVAWAIAVVIAVVTRVFA